MNICCTYSVRVQCCTMCSAQCTCTFLTIIIIILIYSIISLGCIYVVFLSPSCVGNNPGYKRTENAAVVGNSYERFFCLKRTVQRDFWLPVFFIIQTSLGHWSMGLNIFEFWLRFRQVIQILVSKKLTHQGMISQGDWLTGVSYPRDSCFGGFFIDSPGYDTSGRLPCRGIIPRGDWLTGVSYLGETDSPGHHTPGRLTRRGSMIHRGVRFSDLKFE